jgi:hypothetical protein
MRDLLDRVKLEKILEGDAVYFDSVNGFAGTTHPIGTPGTPSNNWIDTKAIATARKTSKIVLVHGKITLDADATGYQFVGNRFADPDYLYTDNVIEINGHTIFNSSFEGINVHDAGAGELHACGYFKDCAIMHATTIRDCCNFTNCPDISATTMQGGYNLFNCSVQDVTTMVYCDYITDCQILGVTNLVDCSVFLNCIFFGVNNIESRPFGGGMELYDCKFYGIDAIKGFLFRFVRCDMSEITTLVDITDGTFLNCALDIGDYNCNHLNGASAKFLGCSGKIDYIINNDGGAGGYLFNVYGTGLNVTIEASCTKGVANIYDEVHVVDNSAGMTVHDYSVESYIKIASAGIMALPDGVYVDSVNGVAGTAWPIGTPGRPVSNLTDALVIAIARNTYKLYLQENFAYYDSPIDLMGWEIIGSSITTSFWLGGGNRDFYLTTFRNLIINGVLKSVASYLLCHNCILNNLSIKGDLYDCDVYGSIVVIAGLKFFHCHFSNAIIDGTSNGDFDIYDCGGILEIDKLTGGPAQCIHGNQLHLTINNTCTGGTINVYGDVTLIDNHTGTCVVNDYRTNQKDTRFFQEAVGAMNVNGTTWKDLLDRSTITKPVRILGFKVTKGGVWAGSPKIRIVDGAGTTKIFPLQVEWVMGTDFTDATQKTFDFPVEVSALKGYKFQFRSSNGGDGAGKTLALDNLDVQELS